MPIDVATCGTSSYVEWSYPAPAIGDTVTYTTCGCVWPAMVACTWPEDEIETSVVPCGIVICGSTW